MTAADIEVVHQFVDNVLDELSQTPIMCGEPEWVPLEMQAATEVDKNGNVPWKAVPSTVSDADIAELEARLNLRYPELYKVFLRYKHFCELPPVEDITFFRHSTRGWKEELLSHNFYEFDPPRLVERGFIQFADYSDWGLVCFDANKQNQQDNDCPIVMLDHELFYDEPLPMKMLYPSFAEMMRSLVAEQQNLRQTEEDL